jgi:UDP-N-acetylglucosamine 1-carboxyvinyltransferase
MDVFRVEGNGPLEGEIKISGSKNSALPIFAACLLTSEPVHLKNIPQP